MRIQRRFANSEERKNTRSAILYIILTIAAVALLYFLGIPALGKLTSFVSSLKGNSSKITNSDTTPPPPPKFRNFSEFTNQQNITLYGNTEAGATVKLTFNGASQQVLADTNGQFSFNVTLANGTNTFAATATDQAGNQSQKSNDYQITFDNKAPNLEMSSPNDNASFYGSTQRQLTIKGSTETGSNVTINDRIVSVDDDGTFQYTTTLNDGSNTFDIKSVDQAGNTAEKNITANFSP